MKDKKLREQVTRLEKELGKIKESVGGLEIKECPKCKHKTLQKKISGGGWWFGCYEYHICLNCGTKWEYYKTEKAHKVEEQKVDASHT